MNEAQAFFNKEIEKIISQKLSDIKISVNEVYKPNVPVLYGMSFQSATNISPVVYLNGFFNQYQEGVDIEDIADSIIRIYQDNILNQDFDVSCFTDFEMVSSRIAAKVINAKLNKEYLESGVAHTTILDGELAVTYYVLLDSTFEGNATITIRNEHIELWHKSLEEINALAISNTPNLLSYEMRDMLDILRTSLRDELARDMNIDDEDIIENMLFQMEDDASRPKMYVLSGKNNIAGACLAYLYPERLKAFLESVGSTKAIVLPSSIHETIIVPCGDLDMGESYYSRMVQDVNQTSLKPEEILSERACLFDSLLETYTLL